jgi:rubrerythrin
MPTANIHAVDVKSTRENLEAAKAGKVYERDVMYPEFIKEAEATGQQEALRSSSIAARDLVGMAEKCTAFCTAELRFERVLAFSAEVVAHYKVNQNP